MQTVICVTNEMMMLHAAWRTHLLSVLVLIALSYLCGSTEASDANKDTEGQY